LSIGQPGSSFTFEVAQHNGISEDLINRAKEKVTEQKLEIDALSASLQKEKSKFKKINTEQYKSQHKAKRAIREYEQKLEKLQGKSERINLFIEQQNKYVSIGKKFFDILGKFKHHKTNKRVNEELKKLASIEKSKILEQEKPVVLEKNLEKPKVKQVSKADIEKAKQLELEAKKEKEKALKELLSVGRQVKLKGHSNKATILEIDGSKLTVQLGNFIVKTSVKEVEI
jgi:DNA mismatch repair protein MutS2